MRHSYQIGEVAAAVQGELYINGNLISSNALQARLAKMQAAYYSKETKRTNEVITSAFVDKLQQQEMQNLWFSGVSSDTRKLAEGNIFVALKGENYDAHNFLTQAVRRGASALLVNASARSKFPRDIPCIVVEDTLLALAELAAWYRRKLQAKIIAVTGSVGKTSTRDMIYSALASIRAEKTAENLNNIIGMSHTILNTSEEAEALVLELGIGEPGEMELLAKTAQADIAVITMIGHSHIVYFGSQEALLKEKLLIVKHLRSGGKLILNADDPCLCASLKDSEFRALLRDKKIALSLIHLEGKALCREAKYYSLITAKDILFYGDMGSFTAEFIDLPKKIQTTDTYYDELDELWAEDLRSHVSGPYANSDGFLDFDRTESYELKVEVNHYGLHMVQNSLFALSVARTLTVDPDEVLRGIMEYHSTGARLKRKDGKHFSLIDDSYNASPEAMRSALLYLTALSRHEKRRSVAVLGCVKELGDLSEELHKEIGRAIAEAKPNQAFLCGEWAKTMATACVDSYHNEYGSLSETKIYCYETSEELAQHLKSQLAEGDIVLVKASHAYRMDLVGEELWKYMEE